ncbi:hypothetical protein [Oceanobacillus sp. 1P07AA]|uniref:hypothetical protein n=1 Tax=Oceanobacillus sp. 1P07AA TaxID=3132293 RepID=UPI0039A6A76A
MELTRQIEYDIRLEISNSIKIKVNDFLDEYSRKYDTKIGYFIQYPLILLESLFENAFLEYYKINLDRNIISWFILELKNRLPESPTPFIFNKNDYIDFKNQYSEIKKVYSDFQYSMQLLDMFSISKIALFKEGQELNFKKPIITDEYADVALYYLGLDDKESFKEEQKSINIVLNYLHSYYPYFKKISTFPFIYPEKKHLNHLGGLISRFDMDLVELCYQRIKQDTKKIGDNAKSQLIGDNENLNKVIGTLFYLGQVTHYKYKAFDAHHRFSLEDTLITFDREWLINKIANVNHIPFEVVKKYINYLVLDKGGTLLEFPLVEHQGKIYFIPSSIILNDWHFSLVNGHYFRNIQFTNRDETISASIIKELIKKVQKHSNIKFVYEKYYEFELNGKKENSDVDFAIYDLETNNLLIIECKWKDNVYLPIEDFVKITRTLNEIYKKQLDKHKAFLESNKANIDFIFDNDTCIVNLSEDVEITYIALDKRSQIHIDNKHLLPIYTMLFLLEKFSVGTKLNLKDLINEICSLETNVSYDDEGNNKFSISKTIGETEYKTNFFGLNLDY